MEAILKRLHARASQKTREIDENDYDLLMRLHAKSSVKVRAGASQPTIIVGCRAPALRVLFCRRLRIFDGDAEFLMRVADPAGGADRSGERDLHRRRALIHQRHMRRLPLRHVSW